jgi:tyrosyl-tRNA synthetase
VVDAFVAAGLAPSRSGARRTITEGGAYVNNAKVDDVDAVLGAEQLLHGRYVVLRRGRKALAAGVVEPA